MARRPTMSGSDALSCYRVEVLLGSRRRAIVVVAEDPDGARIRTVDVRVGTRRVTEVLSVTYLHRASDHLSDSGRRRIRGNA